jgi:membrane dipeptidase
VRDKGYARKLTDFGVVKYPVGLETSADYPNLVAAMERRGWKESRIRRVMGENWIDFLAEVWGR